jgi:WD40 repeat protein
VPSVFISYSRHDRDFVERLYRTLADRGYAVWVDWDDIPPSAEWFEEIRAGIAGADGVVYVISPESAVSEVCTRELEHAVEQHKRIVPVVHREPEVGSVPEAAAALNWVFLRDGDDFAAGIEVLVRAVETDLEHVRTHTRLGVAAGRWETSGRDHSQLLRGAELAAAEAWLVAVGDKQPQPAQLQREYLLASRQAATRRQRTIIGGVSLALVVALVLGVIALVQRSTAIHERDLATARFLDAAAQSNDTVDPELSVLLAVKAAGIAPGSTTEEALRESLAASHLRTAFSFKQATGVPDAVWSPDGTRLLVTSPMVSAKIYRPGTTAPAVSLPPPAARGQSVWDASGNRVLIGGAHPAVYDAATGRLIARIPGIAVHVALSSDGTRAATTDLHSVGHVFDVASGKLLATFHPAYRGGVTCFAWSPDDSVIAQCDAESTASSTAPGSLAIWDPRTGRLLHSDHSRHFIDTVAFSPDGREYVYTTTSSPSSESTAALARANGAPGTFVHATATGAKVIEFPGSASAATFSPVGTEVAYATVGDGLGHVYNFASGLNQPLVGATAAITSINFNRAGTYVVTSSDDGVARVYNASTGSSVEQLADGDTGAVLDAGFGLDDTEIATTSADGEARLWTSPEPRPALRIHLSAGLAPAASVNFAAGGERIVEAGLPRAGQTGQGEILDASGLRLVAGFAAPPGYRFLAAGASRDGGLIAALAFRLSGGRLAAELAEAFDARTGRLLATMTPTTPGADPIDATLDYAGDRLAIVEANGDTEEWDPRTGKRLALLPAGGPAVLAAYSPDDSVLAVVHKPTVPARLTFKTELGDVTIDLWNPQTGRLLRQINGPPLTPLIPGVKEFASLSIAFSANSRLIVLAGADDQVWGYATRTKTATAPATVPDGQFAVSLAFSPNDRMLAVGTAAGAYIFSPSSSSWLPGFQHADPSQYSNENGGAVYVGFTRDSRILLTVGDLALEAWDVADHLQLFDAFAARGSLNLDATEFVATAGDQLSLYPCDLCGGLPQLLAVAKRELTRGLTAQEKATYLNTG